MVTQDTNAKFYSAKGKQPKSKSISEKPPKRYKGNSSVSMAGNSKKSNIYNSNKG